MKDALKSFGEKCKNTWCNFKEWVKKINWKMVYDKATTGLLILLMASPLIVFLYIILWFVLQ